MKLVMMTLEAVESSWLRLRRFALLLSEYLTYNLNLLFDSALLCLFPQMVELPLRHPQLFRAIGVKASYYC